MADEKKAEEQACAILGLAARPPRKKIWIAEKFEQADLNGSVMALIKEPSANGDSKVGRFQARSKDFQS